MTVSITIGLPVYNGEAYLDSAMQSLTAQTFRDLQILVSDNASTDSTQDILNKWAKLDSRVRVHRQTENIGAVANFDWVLRNAKGVFFMYAAYDDAWSPDYVELLHLALMTSPSARLAVGQLVTFYDDGRQELRKPVDCSSVSSLLRTVNSGGFYGLFYRDALLHCIEEAASFGYAWGRDFVLLLPLILSAQITGNHAAVYYKRLTPLSEATYRPKTAADSYRLYRNFWHEIRHSLENAPLSMTQRIGLLGDLYSYARNAIKPRRIVKMWVKEKLGVYVRSGRGS